MKRHTSILATSSSLARASASDAPAPATSIPIAESSSGLTQEVISPLNQAILTFFAMVRVMINLGIFDTTMGGEAISDDKRVGRLPRRIHALRTYIRNNLLADDLVTLAAFINVFNSGESSSWFASLTRTAVMERFAELMRHLDAAVKTNDESQILSLLETWIHGLFAHVLTTTKDQFLSNANIQASNQASEQQLTNIRETTTPIDLTFTRLLQCNELISAIAVALAMNYPIRSIELINCDLDRSALRILACGIRFNKTLLHLGFYDSPLKGFGYMRIYYAVKEHTSLKSLYLINVKSEDIIEFPLDVLPVSPNLEVLRVEDNSGFDPDYFAVRSIEQQSDSTEQPNKLRYLSLANCGLGMRTLANILSSVLHDPNVSIETLDLSKNGALPICGGYDALINTFITRNVPSKLKRLNLSFLLFDAESLTIMLQATTKTAAGQVSYLNLSSCHISDDLLEALINALATTVSASTESSIMPTSSSSVQTPYEVRLLPSSSIRTLILAGNPMGDKAALELICAILDGRLPIIELDLSQCGISNKAARMIQLALEERRAQHQNRILFDHVDGVAIEEIQPFLLQTLTLAGNGIAQAILDAIKAAIDGSQSARLSRQTPQHYATKYGPQVWQASDSRAREQVEDRALDLLLSDESSVVSSSSSDTAPAP